MVDSVETWIDTLCAVFELDGDDANFTAVKSYRMFELNETPNAVTPEMIPCAISYVSGVQVEYSAGGPFELLWSGQTEFHLTTDVKPANHAYIFPFFRRILNKAAQNMKLSNKVAYFLIEQNAQDAMQSVVFRNAQGSDDHQGIIVRWKVMQDVSGQYTVSA